VLEVVLRQLVEMGPWALVFAATMVAVFAVYVGIAMIATVASRDHRRTKVRYQVFTDLLDLFRRRR
jgi:hypothetical protein